MQMHDTLRNVQGEGRCRLAGGRVRRHAGPGRSRDARRCCPSSRWHRDEHALARRACRSRRGARQQRPRRLSRPAPISSATRPRAPHGNAILGQLLGSKDRSRTLAARAARQCRPRRRAVVRAMLPGLARCQHGDARRARARAASARFSPACPPLGRLEPRQSPCRPGRHPAPALRRGPLFAARAPARRPPRHRPRRRLLAARTPRLVCHGAMATAVADAPPARRTLRLIETAPCEAADGSTRASPDGGVRGG